MCDVLGLAHEMGVIHRDIKPPNVFMHMKRKDKIVKVLDFGIAKLTGDLAPEQEIAPTEGILGTPVYMAPETLTGDLSGKADVYSPRHHAL